MESGEGSMALQELLDRNELQRLQDGLCRVSGISAYCLNHDGTKITRISGDDRYLHCMQERLAFERVQGEYSIEDLAVEDLEGRKQVAALAIKARGEKELYWIAYRPEEMEEEAFHQVLELLRDASISFLQGKLQSYGAEAESIRSQVNAKQMGYHFRTVQATAKLVALLESKAPVGEVMREWLMTVSTFLELDTAQIFKLQEDAKFMDLICEWRKPEAAPYFDRTSRIPTYSFLRVTEPAVVNADAIIRPEFYEIYKVGLKAVMIFPVCPQEEGGMVLALNHRKVHAFDEGEVQFASDAVKILESILIRRMQWNYLAGARNSMEEILDGVNACICVRDEVLNKVVFVNKQLKNTFGEELLSGKLVQLLSEEMAKEAPQEEGVEEAACRELYYPEKNRWYDVTVSSVRWMDGSTVRLYSLYDVTEKKHFQGRIEEQVYTDLLTGLYNRMCCERDLAIQIDAAKQQQKTGALLYLDLDDFKHINDGLGHRYGDALLKAISNALQRIEGIEKTCYRVGGDEFVIVVPPEVYDHFDKILEEIQEIFKKPWFLKDSDYYCTMSMGVVTFPENGDTVSELVRKADLAVFSAKKDGKSRIEYYDDGTSPSDQHRLDLEKNMRDATAKDCDEFEVYYQPIIDVKAKEPKCLGAEALIRWNSSNLGFMTSTEFVPLAEYLGLINPIGNYVLMEACRQCKEWNDQGFDYKINVNLSVIQLLQKDVVEIIEKALQETGLKPAHLTLEVTESLAINDMDRMQGVLGRIKALGVKLALDDFGTGYSSLNHIREIPFDVIKVDQSFVRDLTEDSYSQSFIKLVSELAQTLGASICVEGIESIEQYQVLKGMQVQYAQGFYFDKPMKTKDFNEKYCKAPSKKKSEKVISISRK